MKCDRPLELGMLADYWSAELAGAEEAAVEEHLLDCSQCTRTLEWVARLTGMVHDVARGGNLPAVLSPVFLEALEREGLRVRQYAPPAGGGVQCTVTRQDDLLVGRLQADLAGITQLDVILRGEDGAMRGRLRDIPYRAEARSEVIFNQPLDAARQLGPDVLVIQLVAVEASGDRIVGQYTFNHSPSVQ